MVGVGSVKGPLPLWRVGKRGVLHYSECAKELTVPGPGECWARAATVVV